ncbi:TetR/AcrR family transcriptional regulator [Ureibacillus aquaedulcis]|uniref:TetR/AcrR family transcriptional regulator n=1 Tax=Ureibacillus aquaedulcis TaxID=3058421 RepID=A0ABT8GUA2_9BACL|nr:TetR/AcrR family transcriptional regulator [Ureibacillus sp. BA0131]MDN4494471.1 TetR/AcrR family transcriptional regulator [Ureibacillus sp. BA0131]
MSVSNPEEKKKRLLSAAYMIVKEEGVSNLTLEAVAKKADVSKGGLLYHYSNKEALIKAMVRDWSLGYFKSIETLVKNASNTTGKWSMAYINAALLDLNNDKHLTSALVAAMYTNPSLLEEYRKEYGTLLDKLMKDGIDPVKITIARLAIDGLWFSEIFDLAPLDEKLKEDVIHELKEMIKEDD